MKKNKYGPGFLVTAAFIGPGTVTAATLAGSKFGYSLIWVVFAAVLSAIIVQETVGRFSLSINTDIASALIRFTKNKISKYVLTILAFIAIIFGCSAYEAGNIIGGSMGLNVITGVSNTVWIIIISVISLFLLLKKDYKLIEKFLIGLVVIMGVSFLLTAIITKPDIVKILKSFVPIIPENSLLNILALLGTTIVPYNLFLYSSVVLKKWKGSKDLHTMRKDLYLSIGIGGLITAAIIVTAATAFHKNGIVVKNPVDLSKQLIPLFGSISNLFLGIGLFAAGLSSAITAPYAAAYTAKGLFGWEKEDWKFKTVFIIVLLTGAIVSGFAVKQPLKLILLAQIANALILPVILIFILYLLNREEVGNVKNTLLQNIMFIIVLALILGINIKKFV